MPHRTMRMGRGGLPQRAESATQRRTSEAQVLALGSCSRTTSTGGRIFDGARRKRNQRLSESADARRRGHVAQVQGDESRSARPGSARSAARKGLIELATAHPEQLIETALCPPAAVEEAGSESIAPAPPGRQIFPLRGARRPRRQGTGWCVRSRLRRRSR